MGIGICAEPWAVIPVFRRISKAPDKKEDARMRKFRQYAATTLIVAMMGSTMSVPSLADVSDGMGGGKIRMVSGR